MERMESTMTGLGFRPRNYALTDQSGWFPKSEGSRFEDSYNELRILGSALGSYHLGKAGLGFRV